MTNQDNQQHQSEYQGDFISITTEDGERIIPVEAINDLYSTCSLFLAKIDSAQESLKAEVDAFAETYDVPKALAMKAVKSVYADKVEGELKKAEAFRTLTDAISK